MKKFWQNNKGFIVGIFLLLFFRTAVADWYHVPSGSMQPNVLIGDRVWVNKLAYDVKVPFSDINLNHHAEPLPGDVIVFQSAQAGDRLIKRVVGVPGDKVAMLNNRLFINGKPVGIQAVESHQLFDEFLNDRQDAAYYSESRPSGDYDQNHTVAESNATATKPYFIRINRRDFGSPDSFPEVEIPQGYFWVMGDNRDNSADSRVIGMVPRDEVIGRAERIVISLDGDNFFMPRDGRYWEAL
ncbi:signal peptidase I [Aliikangiella marina]|uniref:signal peptidase I n=1 Tax=Aliikangiella marina TaxID=1712262 RepID=UPI001AEE7C85|nr:signal peptidase I [Aliikangiella marina]